MNRMSAFNSKPCHVEIPLDEKKIRILDRAIRQCLEVVESLPIVSVCSTAYLRILFHLDQEAELHNPRAG